MLPVGRTSNQMTVIGQVFHSNLKIYFLPECKGKLLYISDRKPFVAYTQIEKSDQWILRYF